MNEALQEIVLTIEKENTDEKSNKKPGEIKDFPDAIYREHSFHFKADLLSKIVAGNGFQYMPEMFLPVITPPPKFKFI
ncbi:MAG: hypothetical protein ABIN01_24765 [Ferruginibacter sp.]